MKYPIITSSPLRALFLGACLLAPRAVQSETVFLDDILALAPGINWADATRRLQDQMNFHRSLELDPIFNELLDDDTTLEYLSGIDLDDTFLQCMSDLNTFYNETPGVLQLQETFERSANRTFIVVDSENTSVDVVYAEEDLEIIRQNCADVGGHYEKSGDVFCSVVNTETGVTIAGTVSGYGDCIANTTSCTAPGRLIGHELSVLIQKSFGADCELIDPSATLDSAGGKIAPSSFAFAGLLVAATSFVQV